jgi:phage gp36-like protein
MAYVTQQLLEDELGGHLRLVEALDDDGDGKIDDGLISRICQRASDAVDSFLSGRYIVPLSPVPKLAVEASTIFACEIIYNRRRQATDEKNPYTSRANTFREELKDIADRKKSLDAQERPAFTPGVVIGRESKINGSSL